MPPPLKHSSVELNWYAIRDCRKLVRHIGRDRYNDRCNLLIAVALTRRVSDLITLPMCRSALAAAERAAELTVGEPVRAKAMLRAHFDRRLIHLTSESQRNASSYCREVYSHQQSVSCKSGDRVAIRSVNPDGGYVEVAELVIIIMSRGVRHKVRQLKG